MSGIKTKIPLSEPFFNGNEWKYVKECLDSGWVSSVGKFVDQFEHLVADYTQNPYGVATMNGTSALHIALQGAGVQSGNEVIVPTLTFVATSNAVTYCRAHPVFMDCDPDTLCLDTEKTIEFIQKHTFLGTDGYSYNRFTKRKIAALLPVHMYGHPVDMDPLVEFCKGRNIALVEDACESLGSEYKGKKTGSLGTLGCFSFNGNKIITSGGGGMVVTQDETLAHRMKHLTTQAKVISLDYEHDQIGYNYRLTNLQAALGVAQMKNIDKRVKAKRRNAKLYRKLLSDMDTELLWEKPWAKSNFWFYTIRVPKTVKQPLMEHLIRQGIHVRPVWKPNHLLKMYTKHQTFALKAATEAYETCFNLPCSPHLTEETIALIVNHIKMFFD